MVWCASRDNVTDQEDSPWVLVRDDRSGHLDALGIGCTWGTDGLTFVELQTEVGLDVQFLREVVLVELGMDDVFQCGWPSEWTRHGRET